MPGVHKKAMEWERRTRELEMELARLKGQLVAEEPVLGCPWAEQRLYETVIDFSESLICVLGAKGQALIWNSTAERITGYSRTEVVGGSRIIKWLMPRSDLRREIFQAVRDINRQKRGLKNFETEICCRDGSRRTIAWNVNVLSPPAVGSDLYILQGQDLTGMRRSQLQMELLAFYDTLTELPNRRLYRDRLQQALEAAHRTGDRVAVMFLDLDRFKRVNDNLGHEAGDELLRQVARRLSGCVRSQDTVARIGGDEFTLLLPEIQDFTTTSVVANKIFEVLQLAVVLGSQEVVVTGSIGIAIAPEDGNEVSDLMRSADLAMYRAKEKGRNTFQYFTDELNQRMDRQQQLEHELRLAVRQRQFFIQYQPIYTADGDSIVAIEALLRWRHLSRGTIYPDEFLEILEETGLILDLGDWILDQVCAGAVRIQKTVAPLVLAVNLSSREFLDPGLPLRIHRALERTGLPPHLLQLEMAESLLMDDPDHALFLMKELKKLEVALCLDDFGGGYLSMRHLRRFPLDMLKVDRVFVRNIPDGPADMEITAALIAMAHKLELKVVAKGVETGEQLAFLYEQGCDLLQGYYCGIPMDEEALYYLLKVGDPVEQGLRGCPE